MSACACGFTCMSELYQVFGASLLISNCVVTQMFKGKENHQELIQELRTVHALQREEQELQRADKELVITLKKQRDEHQHKVKHAENKFFQTSLVKLQTI